MIFEVNSSDTYISSDLSEIPIPRPIRLIILVIFDIPSLICTIFILFNILNNRLLRESLHNHVILALLFSILPTQLVDIPFHIIYLSLGYVWPTNPNFCLFWLFISIGIFDTTGILMGYASIERHILIFHDRCLINLNKRIYFHYIPLFSVIIYSFIFYIYVILFPPCINNFNYEKAWCSYPCYYDDKILSIYDSLVNVVFPTFIFFIFSLLLLLRIIYQKRHFMLKNQWRKYRKIIIQLLSESLLLIIFNLPLMILILAHLCGLPSNVGLEFGQYAYFFTYFIPLLLPFICLHSMPDINKKLRKLFIFQCRQIQLRRLTAIQPIQQ